MRAIFFDFDGVLVDSVDIKAAAFRHMFRHHGDQVMDAVEAHHRAHGGVTRAEKLRHYHQAFLGHELDVEALGAECDRFSAAVEDRVVAAPSIPGAAGFLETWRGHAAMFVVSATPQDELRRIVERRGWTHLFTGVFGAPDPKEEHMRRELQAGGWRPSHAVMFGDARTDLLAARAVGVPFVGIGAPDSPLFSGDPGVRRLPDFNNVPAELLPGS